MKIIVAPDSYKECLSSRAVALTICEALADVDPEAEIIAIPVADGGEGTVEALTGTLGGRIVSDIVSDPLCRPVKAEYGVAGDLAIIECAAACGLSLLAPVERNPLITSSRGVGELIVAAIRRGCCRFIIGLGGSATNDGGTGMMSVPGILELAEGKEFMVACDVDTPFVGPNGTSRVFAPQKGASPGDVEILEARMTATAANILADTGIDVLEMPGAGAAGGLGGALRAYFGASLKSGIDLVLDTIGFDRLLSGADLVITGEGRSDFQTVMGKTAFGILRRAQLQNVPVALVSGAVRDEDVLLEAGFSHIGRVSPEDLPLDYAMRPEVASNNIGNAIRSLLPDIKLLSDLSVTHDQPLVSG